jgi:hypothetical protein
LLPPWQTDKLTVADVAVRIFDSIVIVDFSGGSRGSHHPSVHRKELQLDRDRGVDENIVDQSIFPAAACGDCSRSILEIAKLNGIDPRADVTLALSSARDR